MEKRAKPRWQQQIAAERIEILFNEAQKQAKAARFDLANRYIFLARKLSMKYQVQIPRQLRRRFCHSCYHYLLPGKNVQIRINKRTKAVEWTCGDCGHVNRYPYIKEKKAKKK